MKSKILTVSCILLAFLFSGISAEKKTKDDQIIRVAVDMVSLPVVVTDKAGKRITDLKKEDFEIYEDGTRQEIAGFAATDEPICVVLALDTSGSTELRLAKIQNAAIKFVHQLHPDDEVAIMSFANDVRLQEDFSINRDKNEYGIKKTRTGGETTLYEAVWLAMEDVLKPVRERKSMVLFTDGVDNHSEKATINETLDLAKESPATIYCVYYNTETDQKEINRRSTTGRTTRPPVIWNPLPPAVSTTGAGSTPEEYQRGRMYLEGLADNSGGIVLDGTANLEGAFAEIARELASQYSLGYYPNNPKHDGKFRKVQVRLNKPGLVARTKKGYYVKKDRQK